MKMYKSVLFILTFTYVGFISGSALPNEADVSKTKISNKIGDIINFSVHYDIHTNQTLKKLSRPGPKPEWSDRQLFSGRPCTCEDFRCSCCAGVRIYGFDFERQACAMLSYEPKNSMIDVDLKLNNDSIYKRTFSSQNQQFCVPVIPVTFAGPVDMCIKLSDIVVKDQRLHVCMYMLTRVAQYPVLILQFNCMDMGPGGVTFIQPGGTVNSTENTIIIADTGATSNSIIIADTGVTSNAPPSDTLDPVTEASTAVV